MFLRALTSKDPLPVWQLIPGSEAMAMTIERSHRQVVSWLSRDIGQRALVASGADTGYGVEKALLRDEDELAFPVDRPHLIDRLLQGEPVVNGILSRADRSPYSTYYWLKKLFTMFPSVEETLRDPVWPLLSPEILSRTYLWDLTNSITGPLLRRGVGKEHNWRLSMDPRFEALPATCNVPRIARRSRAGLAFVLFELRQAELDGDLFAYYLNLLEALDRLRQPDLDPDLNVFRKEGPNFLVACFGPVKVSRHSEKDGQERAKLFERLEAAAKALEMARAGQERLIISDSRLRFLPPLWFPKPLDMDAFAWAVKEGAHLEFPKHWRRLD